jgi:hypothetical protein
VAERTTAFYFGQRVKRFCNPRPSGHKPQAQTLFLRTMTVAGMPVRQRTNFAAPYPCFTSVTLTFVSCTLSFCRRRGPCRSEE